MPTYQYACTNCDERIEVVQKFSDDPLTECAVCASRLRKVFSPVGIVFKGSGFYRTDSRASANGSNGKKDKEPAASDGSGSGSGSGSSTESSSADTSTASKDSKSSGESKPAESAGKSDSGASSSGKGTEKVA